MVTIYALNKKIKKKLQNFQHNNAKKKKDHFTKSPLW